MTTNLHHTNDSTSHFSYIFQNIRGNLATRKLIHFPTILIKLQIFLYLNYDIRSSYLVNAVKF